MQQKYETRWSKCQRPVDLMLDKPTPSVGQEDISISQFLFNWYKPINNNKTNFIYETSDMKWIDVEMVISSVTLTMKLELTKICVLHATDRQALDDYLKTMTSISI